MMSLIRLNTVQNKMQQLAWRVRLSILAFVQAPSLEPIIRLKDGSYIDLSTKKIVLTEDTHIHCNGNLKLTSDKHVVIRSGRTPDPLREGYIHSVWTNANEDELGRPIKETVMPCNTPGCDCKK